MADTLSHRDTGDSGEVLALTAPTFQLYEELWAELTGDSTLHHLCAEVHAGTRGDEWKLTDNITTVAGRIYIPSSSSCLPTVLTATHGVAHEGVERTMHSLRHDFFLPGACAIICDHARACVACQQDKVDQFHPVGLLQALDVLSAVWVDIAMDFIKGFPPHQQQVRHLDGGGSVLKVHPLHSASASLHDDFSSSCILHRHHPLARPAKLHH
jgi:hypothetical protein